MYNKQPTDSWIYESTYFFLFESRVWLLNLTTFLLCPKWSCSRPSASAWASQVESIPSLWVCLNRSLASEIYSQSFYCLVTLKLTLTLQVFGLIIYLCFRSRFWEKKMVFQNEEPTFHLCWVSQLNLIFLVIWYFVRLILHQGYQHFL